MGLALGRLGLHHPIRYLGKLRTGSDPPKGGPLVEAPLMLRQACPDSSEAEDALVSGCLKETVLKKDDDRTYSLRTWRREWKYNPLYYKAE